VRFERCPDLLSRRRGEDPAIVVAEQLTGLLLDETVGQQPVRQQRQVAIAVEDRGPVNPSMSLPSPTWSTPTTSAIRAKPSTKAVRSGKIELGGQTPITPPVLAMTRA
jgi:hypothetical protein